MMCKESAKASAGLAPTDCLRALGVTTSGGGDTTKIRDDMEKEKNRREKYPGTYGPMVTACPNGQLINPDEVWMWRLGPFDWRRSIRILDNPKSD